MALFDLFRRARPIADAETLGVFMAGEAAFLVQKTTWEYSRARSGVLWQKLFKEAAFKDAIEASCWANWPLSLSFVGEMVAGTLRSQADMPAADAAAAAGRVALSVVEGQALPATLAAGFRADAAAFVGERIARTQVAPPKAVKDIPLDGHTAFFERLPIHPDLTKHDSQLLQNSLRVHLCRAHETLLDRLDAEAIRAALPGAD